jgi:hypothetical protein
LGITPHTNATQTKGIESFVSKGRFNQLLSITSLDQAASHLQQFELVG